MRHFNYNETLNTSEWKEKRLEIIKRDKSCQRCGSLENLEVHHFFYIYGVSAWAYPDYLLITLCRKCHQKETDNSILLNNLINYIKLHSLFSDEIIKIFFSKLDNEYFEEYHLFNDKIKELKKMYKP